MPERLVERINASLAAEQAQRAARKSHGPVSPLVATVRHRPGRLVFAMAGAAAAVILVAVASSINLSGSQTTATSVGAAIASTSSSRDNLAEAAPSADASSRLTGRLDPGTQSSAATKGQFSGTQEHQELSGTRVALRGWVPQIRLSHTRYTQADFLAQAITLRDTTITPTQFLAAPNVGPASTTDWLRECMAAIGASQMQVVKADIAFYEGQPAVVVVAKANGSPLAYVLAPQCSHADPMVLHQGTPLP